MSRILGIASDYVCPKFREVEKVSIKPPLSKLHRALCAMVSESAAINLVVVLCLLLSSTQAWAENTQCEKDVSCEVLNSRLWADFVAKVEEAAYIPADRQALASFCTDALTLSVGKSLAENTAACISSALKNLGRNTRHISAEEASGYVRQPKNESVGIGLELKVDPGGSGLMQVVTTIEGTPAEQGGVVAGDLIQSIDGVDVKNQSLDEVIKSLKGKVGTTTKVSIVRNGAPTYLELVFTRRPIVIDSVTVKLIESGKAYLRIRYFNDKTRYEFLTKLNKLAEKSNIQFSDLIVDLRSNGGGTVPGLISIGALLLPEGAPILSVVGGKVSDNRTYRADASDFSPIRRTSIKPPFMDLQNIRLTLLVNGQTASGAEALVEALRAHKRARVVGVLTHGSAEISQLFALIDGSLVKLQIGTMLSPTGWSWAGKGIYPDVLVNVAEAEAAAKKTEGSEYDPFLHKSLELLQSSDETSSF